MTKTIEVTNVDPTNSAKVTVDHMGTVLSVDTLAPGDVKSYTLSTGSGLKIEKVSDSVAVSWKDAGTTTVYSNTTVAMAPGDTGAATIVGDHDHVTVS